MATVEVFGDIWCPFTHVGLTVIADERRRRGRSDLVIDVRAWPLELVNGEAMAVERVARNIAALKASVAQGLFCDFDPAKFPSSTLPALALVAAGRRQSLKLGETVSYVLRRALFEQGRDVGDTEVLLAIGIELGIGAVGEDDFVSVRSDYAEGIAREVVGSPHFFINHRSVFCPALSITHDETGTVAIARDEPGITALLDDVFAAP